jgi:hypothetical protein
MTRGPLGNAVRSNIQPIVQDDAAQAVRDGDDDERRRRTECAVCAVGSSVGGREFSGEWLQRIRTPGSVTRARLVRGLGRAFGRSWRRPFVLATGCSSGPGDARVVAHRPGLPGRPRTPIRRMLPGRTPGTVGRGIVTVAVLRTGYPRTAAPDRQVATLRIPAYESVQFYLAVHRHERGSRSLPANILQDRAARGPCVPGERGSQEGPAVSLASRISQVALPDRVRARRPGAARSRGTVSREICTLSANADLPVQPYFKCAGRSAALRAKQRLLRYSGRKRGLRPGEPVARRDRNRNGLPPHRREAAANSIYLMSVWIQSLPK